MQKTMALRAAIYAVLLRVAVGAITCLDDWMYGRGGRSTGDQKLVARHDSDKFRMYCESEVADDGSMIRSKSEFFAGKIEHSTSDWDSAAYDGKYGKLTMMVPEINGFTVFDNSKPQDYHWSRRVKDSYDDFQVCATGHDGKQFQYSDAMAFESLINGTKLTTYAFKNNDIKAAQLANETRFGFDGSMLGCKLGVVLEMPVPQSGDLTFKIDSWIHGPKAEPAVSETSSEAIYSANFDNRWSPINSSIPFMTLSKTVWCAANGTSISTTNSGFNMWGGGVTFTVPAADVAGCGSVFWEAVLGTFAGGFPDMFSTTSTITAAITTSTTVGTATTPSGTTPGASASDARRASCVAARAAAFVTLAVAWCRS